MGKPVNLNRYRKEKTRAADKARADQNAVAFGRAKAEKEIVKPQHDTLKRDLDNHELDE